MWYGELISQEIEETSTKQCGRFLLIENNQADTAL